MTRDDTILLYNPNPEQDRPSLDVPLSLLAASKYLDKAGYKIKIIKDNYQHLTTITESERYFALLPYKKDLPTNLDEETLRLVEQDLQRKEKT